jgi:hypothetical protein
VPNAFLSVFSDEAAAQAAVNASPMRYRLFSDVAPSAGSEAHKKSAEGEAETRAPSGEQDKLFELNLSPSKFDHEHYIANEPLFGPWIPVDRKHSFFGGGLEVPRSLMSSGLRDWDTDGRKWRNTGDETEGSGAALEGLGVRSLGANGSGKDGVNTQWRIDQRRKKRLGGQLNEGVMGGLKNYRDQAEKERGAMDSNQEGQPREQEKEVQQSMKGTAFGAWPGRNFRDVLREKEMQKGSHEGTASTNTEFGSQPVR